LRSAVFHVYDQADVGKNLVQIGRARGRRWLRFPGPSPKVAQFHSIEYLWNRTLFSLMDHLPGIPGLTLHIHGGHIGKWFRSSRNPRVIHVHGSEVRDFGPDGDVVLAIEPETREAILEADRVVFSTPDLSKFVRAIRPDSSWLPHSISPEARNNCTVDGTYVKDSIDVFFPHAWSKAKGVSRVVDLIQRLRSGPGGGDLLIAGIALGPNQDMALECGVKLFPPSSRSELVNLMKSSRLVLGQGYGIVAMTDLEAISSGCNFLPFPLEDQTREAYGFSESDQPTPSIRLLNEMAESTLYGANDLGIEKSLGKILAKHDDAEIVKELDSIYSQ